MVLTIPLLAVGGRTSEVAPDSALDPAVDFVSQHFGLSLSDAGDRIANQVIFAQLSASISTAFSENFAGSVVDTKSGRFQLLLTNADVGPIYEAIASSPIAKLIDISIGLRLSRRQLESYVTALPPEPVLNQTRYSAYVDERANVVRVSEYLDPDERADTSAIDRVVAADPAAYSVDAVEADADNADLSCSDASVSCDHPMRGGVFIADLGGVVGGCTAGFDAHGPNGDQYVITAGHCLAAGAGDWYTEYSDGSTIYTLGPEGTAIYSSVLDGGRIHIGSNTHSDDVFVQNSANPGGSTTRSEHYGINGVVYSFPRGTIVCKTGINGHTACGEIIGEGTNPAGVTRNIFVRMAYATGNHLACHGDSGAAVVAGHYGYGTITAGGPDYQFNPNCYEAYWFEPAWRSEQLLDVVVNH